MPGDAVAHAWTSIFLSRFPARFEESLKFARQGVSLDPLSTDHNAILARILWYMGREDECCEVLAQTRELHPLYPLAYCYAGAVRSVQGRHEEAIALFDSAPASARSDPMFMGLWAFTLGKAGRMAEAGQLLTHMLQTRQESYFSPSYLCLASLGTGDVEAALGWAEKAVDELDPYFTYAGSLPILAELRDRPRFTAALSRMGL